MKPTNTSNTSETEIKKEWSSPEIAELPVGETNQLYPPDEPSQDAS